MTDQNIYKAQLSENSYNLSNEDLEALIDAFHYATTTPMIWLIKKLKTIDMYITSGIQVSYVDEHNIKQAITKLDFKAFCLKYFDDFVYNEIYSDSRLYN